MLSLGAAKSETERQTLQTMQKKKKKKRDIKPQTKRLTIVSGLNKTNKKQKRVRSRDEMFIKGDNDEVAVGRDRDRERVGG